MIDDSVLIRRFSNFCALRPEDEQRLRAVAGENVRTKAARRDLIRDGERPRVVYLVLSGWAYRHKVLEDGRRQILQFLLPGDLCDVHNVVLKQMDHSIGALTELSYAEISHQRLEEIERVSADLRQALWWHSATAIAVQREWTVNIGQRNALERLSHLFCELFLRLQVVNLTNGQSCDMPVTQADLGDAVGLTSVHVNRTVQELRERGLIVLNNRRLTIPNFAALRKAASFSDDYLHLGNQKPPGSSLGHGPARVN